MLKLRAGRTLSRRGGHGIDRRLHDMRNAPDVFWSAGANSYVAVALDEPTRLYGIVSQPGFQIVSINGIGEIRWAYAVTDTWLNAETKDAINYFFEEVAVNTPVHAITIEPRNFTRMPSAVFVAVCTCGWASRPHSNSFDATRDGDGHVSQVCLANE